MTTSKTRIEKGGSGLLCGSSGKRGSCFSGEPDGMDSCIAVEILETIDLGMIILDLPRQKVVLRNRAALNLLAGPLEKEDFPTLRNLILEGLEEPLAADLSGKPKTFLYRNRVLAYNVNILSEGQVLVSIRDVTEQTRLESIAEAVNYMENIGYIFSGIRHEIGNPINSIKMTMSVLKGNLSSYSLDTIREYVDRTLSEILRVEFLLKSLKSFSMFEKPSIENLHLPSLLDNLWHLVRDDFQKNGVAVETVFSPVAERVLVDPRAFQQVMLNILTNALDALSGRTAPAIAISTLRLMGQVRVVVEDNGCGMTEDVQRNLFRPFYTTKPHGNGLGLVIARKMMSSMNSRIEIQSRENIGTRVIITLPEGPAD